MAQFRLEKEFENAMKLDAPLQRGPIPRWQRKALETSNSSLSGSMNVSGRLNLSSLNASLLNGSSHNNSMVKTPRSKPSSSSIMGKTPKLSANKNPGTTCLKEHSGKKGSQGNTPRAFGKSPTGDRFIPNRSATLFKIGSFLINQENELIESPRTLAKQKIMSEQLNGCDIDNLRIIAYQKKAESAPESYQNSLRVIYSNSKAPTSTKKNVRHIPNAPDRILDAPDMMDDYYLNLLDWGGTNLLAVALSSYVYLWNADNGGITQLVELDTEEQQDYVSSVCWSVDGAYLGVGTATGDVQLWDAGKEKRVRVMRGHISRVACLSWNGHILSSGCRSGTIHHHDVRVAEHHVGTLNGHTQEVCGLKWSPDFKYLASGGNDNLLNIWPIIPEQSTTETTPLYSFTQHQGAVKALSWCPWQPNILASGGGSADRCIRFWNCNLGTCLNTIDTKSQVCTILWSPEYKELISSHGFTKNQLIIWKYPDMHKVAELTGHTARVLFTAMSPDGSTVVSAAGDETLRLWKCFEPDVIKKKEASKATKHYPSVFNQVIR